MNPPVKEFGQFPLYNFYEAVRGDPHRNRQLMCDELLMTEFTCPLEGRIQALWSHHNYFVYVLEGKKIWHTPSRAFELTKDSCVFVRKGASIVEQFFDAEFCGLIFFIPDDFICETLRPLEVKPLKSTDTHARSFLCKPTKSSPLSCTPCCLILPGVRSPTNPCSN